MDKNIDFEKKFPASELFSGRKNGVRARKLFVVEDVDSFDKVIVKCKESQLITSSYFLGVLEPFIRKYSSLEEVLEHISMEGLSDYCQQECLDALEFTLLDDTQGF